MPEEKRLRFIREEPVFALTLRQYYFKLLPQDYHKWLWDWIEDVGTVMRSRSMMVSMVASIIYYVLIIGILRSFPVLKSLIEGGG